MMMWFRYVLLLLCMVSAPTLLAQSARSYVAASVRLARPQGALHDSLSMRQTMQYDLRYLWSPSRSWIFGIGGSWMNSPSGNGPSADTLSGDVSITQMTVSATWRPLKHGLSPLLGVEGGFGYLIPTDEIASLPVLTSTLGACYGAHVGVGGPLSERVDLNLTGRWMRLTTETPLDLIAVSLSVVLRIQ
ncbi:MAG: hypothetical protein ACK475_00320 [Bacteroidota bacterium]|jgi:hypothetical protein